MAEGLELQDEDRLLRVVLSHGEGNLFSSAMCLELANALRQPPPGVDYLLLEARGDSFCLGRERGAADVEQAKREVAAVISVFEALEQTRLVTLVAVQGDAAGFGVGLVALADIALAHPRVRFSFPEIEIGLAPVAVLAWLPRIVDRKLAFYLTSTGEPADAQTAEKHGLITSISERPKQRVEEILEGFLQRPHHTVPEIRRFLKDTKDASARVAYHLAEERLVIGSLQRLSGTH